MFALALRGPTAVTKVAENGTFKRKDQPAATCFAKEHHILKAGVNAVASMVTCVRRRLTQKCAQKLTSWPALLHSDGRVVPVRERPL
jgi:hypothetical protein